MFQLPSQPILPWNHERAVAISAVRRACIVTQKVFDTLVAEDYMTKGDESPVTGTFLFLSLSSLYDKTESDVCVCSSITVGDFAAQAVIASILGNAFPDDPIVGEEDSAELRKPGNKELSHHVTTLVNEGLTDERLHYEKEEWGIGEGYDISPREVRDVIDRGNFEGGNVGRTLSQTLVIYILSSYFFSN